MNQPQSNESVEEKVVSQDTVKPVPTPVVKKEEVKTESPKEVPSPDPDDNSSPMDFVTQEPYRSSPLFYEVANYFGVEERDYDSAKDQLSVIVDWAVEEGKSVKSEDILITIRKLEDSIMMPGWGEKRHANMYRYLRLASKEHAIRKAMSAFQRNGGS